ncbi:hypothetical protein [Streptomyces sp. DvalAA-19]|uniref:hypothetical protein n=1 Tax=Streptomyces sp. DvalAA-19 TaxID=1839761 RepID=UPI00081B2715|nr:hypothetical protein [Streptomyces sp. DvalAA-19]SCD57237.1 hypothetical protein GA0115244_10632 [Streptomyces sp. DvalAA-19]
MLRSLSCNAIRASAAAVAVGLMALGAPAVAQAAEADPVLKFTDNDGSDEIEVFPNDPSRLGSVHVDAWNTGSQALKDFTVTIDARAFTGQVSLRVASPCVEKAPLLVVCDGEKLNYGKPLEPGGFLSVTGAAFKPLMTARSGFTGDVRVFAEAADGVLLGETTLKATLAGLGPVSYHRGPVRTEAKPGETLRVPVGFMQYSARPLKGVYVSMHHSRGLAFSEKFSNCEYGEQGPDLVVATCYVETPVEPGASYDLDGLVLKVGATALDERWGVSVHADKADVPQDITDAHRGTGRELRLVPRTDGPGELAPRGLPGRVTVANTLDFEAVGATVDGKAGQVVKAELGVRNNGPATIPRSLGDEPGEDPAVEVHVVVPPGTTAVKVTDRCHPDGKGSWGQPGGKTYRCRLYFDEYYFHAGQSMPFAFELRIDRPGDLAPGSIKVSRRHEDNKPKNNTAPITVTVDGKLGASSGASQGGSDSGGGSASGGSGTGGSGASGSEGATTPGGSGSATSGGAREGGATADTGSGAVSWYAAVAGAALAAGGALIIAVRRRRVHGGTR